MQFLRSLTFLAFLLSWSNISPLLLAAPNADIIFVTQVPLSRDFATINATLGNQNADPQSAGRGGDLYIRYADGSLKNLTAAAGFGGAGNQGANAIAVRDPAVHWSGQKVIFSMVVGGPSQQYQVKDYYFQLYEMTSLGKNETPLVTKVSNQPQNYNNIMPLYGSDDRIIFVSDRPRDGQRHLYPQRDEYESAATNTGLWSLDVQSGDLFMLDHAPSGDFHPIIDSFGRVLFTRWDHLQRDQQKDAGTYGAFNFSGESASDAPSTADSEVFPEPRANNDPDIQDNLNLHTFNHFFPWQINEDGTEAETLNHVGRHELHGYFNVSFNDDAALEEHYGDQDHEVENFFHLREDPLHPGTYYAINCPEFGTHTAGQVVSIAGPPSLKAGQMQANYVTHPETASTDDTPSSNHSGLYRNPLPLNDGTLVVSHTSETRQDQGEGTLANPQSRYAFRLKTLKKIGSYWVPDQALTTGIQKTVSFYDPDTLVTYSNVTMWELQPVELRARERPSKRSALIPSVEQSVIDQTGVNVDELKQYLVDNNLALIVSRNLTTRDSKDRQQPFNLKVANSSTQSVTDSGKVYEIAHVQFFQGDLIRGYYGGYGDGVTPQAGRRVLAQIMHDPAVNNPTPSGPAGSVEIGTDGSMAAFVPARRALTWHMTDTQGHSVVKERYWLTFQPGEIRVCASCHGVTSTDQLGRSEPTNSPEALRLLLEYWKGQPHDRPDFSLSVKPDGSGNKIKAGKKFKINVTGNAQAASRAVELYLKVNNKSCAQVMSSFQMGSDAAKILRGTTPKISKAAKLSFSLKYNRTQVAIADTSIIPYGRFTPDRKIRRAAQDAQKICRAIKAKLK